MFTITICKLSANDYITSNDCTVLDEYIKKTYPNVNCFEIGKSFLGKPLYAYSIGNGRPIVFVGVHHAAESITFSLLSLFAERLFSLTSSSKSLRPLPLKNNDITDIISHRKVVIIPMLNPDGVDINSGIIDPSCNAISYERKKWQSNARGVDLNHNYPVGFEQYKIIEKEQSILAGVGKYSGECPLSEPESASLYNYINSVNPLCILTLHTQGEEIYANGANARILSGARILARQSGYKLAVAKDSAAYGGLTDWAIYKGIPSYTIECGRGENPLPQSDCLYIYTVIENMLFRALTLF